MVTPAVPMEIEAFGSMEPISPVPSYSRGQGGQEPRPFTLKNLKAPRKFLGQGKPATTTWLIEMQNWTRLSKVLESDLWDVMETRMIGGARTWINE